MTKRVIAVFDSVAKLYHPPFFCLTTGEAVRGFSDAVNNPETQVSKHPKDYLLYEIGEWDDVEGVITSIVPPNRLALGSDFVKPAVTH